jgi:hypothetical protein
MCACHPSNCEKPKIGGLSGELRKNAKPYLKSRAKQSGVMAQVVELLLCKQKH